MVEGGPIGLSLPDPALGPSLFHDMYATKVADWRIALPGAHKGQLGIAMFTRDRCTTGILREYLEKYRSYTKVGGIL